MQYISPQKIVTKDISTLVSSNQYYLFVMCLQTTSTTICKRAPIIQGISFIFLQHLFSEKSK